MKPTTLYLCEACKQSIKNGLKITELKTDMYKDKCAICGRQVYGSWYEISDKEEKKG